MGWTAPRPRLCWRVGMGGRAVEGTGLENRQGCKPLVGSNPTPSAILAFLRAATAGSPTAPASFAVAGAEPLADRDLLPSRRLDRALGAPRPSSLRGGLQ